MRGIEIFAVHRISRIWFSGVFNYSCVYLCGFWVCFLLILHICCIVVSTVGDLMGLKPNSQDSYLPSVL